MLIAPQLAAINADPAELLHVSSTHRDWDLIKFGSQKVLITKSYDRDKLVLSSVKENDRKFRDFRPDIFRLYRRIFGFFLHGRWVYARISIQNLQISGNSTKKYLKICRKVRKFRLCRQISTSKFFLKKIYKSILGTSRRVLTDLEEKIQKFVDTVENGPVQISLIFINILRS